LFLYPSNALAQQNSPVEILDAVRLRSVCVDVNREEFAQGTMTNSGTKFRIRFKRMNDGGADAVQISYDPNNMDLARQYTSIVNAQSVQQYLYMSSMRRIREANLRMDANMPDTDFPALFLNLCDNLKAQIWTVRQNSPGVLFLAQSSQWQFRKLGITLFYNDSFLLERLVIEKEEGYWIIEFSDFRTYLDGRRRPLRVVSAWKDTTLQEESITTIKLEGWSRINPTNMAGRSWLVQAYAPIRGDLDTPILTPGPLAAIR